MGFVSQSLDEIVDEIMRTLRSLPPRPGGEDVEAAMELVRNVDREEQSRIDAIARQRKSFEVPDDLFFVLQEMQRSLVFSQCKDQKREALKLLDLENVHQLFDELIQRASKCIPIPTAVVASAASTAPPSTGSNGSSTTSLSTASSSPATASSSKTGCDSSSTFSSSAFYSEGDGGKIIRHASRDDSFLKSTHSDGMNLQLNSSAFKPVPASGEVTEKLSLIKLASLIEVSSRKGSRDLSLQNKLMDQIDWLPDSIGKLSGLITLDLSENRILILPRTIGTLSSLTKLDLCSNRLAELPDSCGDLISLQCLGVRGNQLTTLPASFGRLTNLVELDLSSNRLSILSDAIGNLSSLRKLIVEANDLEELPYTIGNCTSLVELRVDYNRLKALPEAIGRLGSLEILSIRYNNIKGFPTSMASMLKLKELDASFNELELIPESLCLATNLVKLNIGNNFADLQSLPRAIGNLEMLEELDISNNQIQVLPDSFGMLTHLHVLYAEENPLEVPPRHIVGMGAEAVVHYMGEFVAKRDLKTQSVKTAKTWAPCCFSSRPTRKKHDILDHLKA
ncbi:plant intracellular Ras-group-related LRR protein 4-like isoform X2 [Dioscorea cayenensis subsp. rotundata]|uniref:Plant intracellular Ras-group-related LRR protein 4-like isoform X2 n=1 Tax=Dioscorea cayennensis subsp. rotundata TaxID=55577 RepID=A0AB40BDB4_DIOCR|nr:plant intracellular Ras-group-related LRR protein 4-like isoform X2 [Dioscorea cayenensis subsp. rotundata]